MKNCKIQGCKYLNSSKKIVRGLCKDHYNIWHRKHNPACYKKIREKWLAKPGNKEKAKKAIHIWQQANKTRVAHKAKKWKQANKIRVSENYFKRTYGITYNDYNQLLVKQNFRCSICKIHNSKLNRSLYVDHCHKTGKVRGLLCFNCNVGLGIFKDSLSFLKQAYIYLKSFS